MTEAYKPTDRLPKASLTATKTITAESLFQGAREISIEHAGVRYRLRLTRRNKLILQK